ncbi:MAG: hypothetical protein RL748_3851 [Pseudomonadota bacterium]
MTKPAIPRYQSGHPAAMLPWIRDMPPSLARDVLHTLILNTLIACLFAIVGLALSKAGFNMTKLGALWWSAFVIANCIGFLFHGLHHSLHLLPGKWRQQMSGWQSRTLQAVSIGCCVVLGSVLGAALLELRNPLDYLQDPRVLVRVLFIALLTAMLLYWVLLLGHQRMRRQADAAQQREQMAASAALLAQAQLRALQAQIEPHFLYNTLANVLGLIAPQPQQAEHMLERLIDFLRASLAASRADQATLGSEADLLAAYLDIMALRMGARLSYRIEIAPELREMPIAPMLLQPLVENAISHGLEPKLEGGSIRISAQVRDGCLLLAVADTGMGITTDAGALPGSRKSGGGVGLANLRQRLQQIYGDAARLQLQPNQPCGLCATLILPLPGPAPTGPAEH